MYITDLKTEYRCNPIGIDSKQPRLSWKLKSETPNMMQESYRILTFADEAQIHPIWDSGTILSSQSQRVLWNGPALSSMERVYWKICAVISNGEMTEQAESDLAFFEMGLLSEEDWKCQWIEPTQQEDWFHYQPSPILRRRFEVKKNLKQARIYQTAHGLYEFWINGKTGTEDKFKPGFTSYQNRLQYQTYDITGLLTEGENIWAAALGDGWWRGTLGGSSRNNWGYQLQYLGQIVLTYEDGTTEYVCTDDGFRSSTGGIRECDLRAGEVYDARQEPTGWKEAGFDDSGWTPTVPGQGDYCSKTLLIASASVPVLEREHFTARAFRDASGVLVLDFGQNLAGYVKMTLRGCTNGQTITLQHGEDIKDGCFSMANLQGDMFENDAFQRVSYICSGEAEETYCPTFAVFGFRYVKVTGYDGEILPGDFEAIAVYSALEETGDFTCSNELINQLVKNSRWSQKGNYLDVPTDCPTRERSPWTGDSQVYCRTAADFMNVYPFFEKWMQEFTCDQLSSGKLKSTIPSGGKNKAENERAKAAFFESIAGKQELSMTDYMILQMYQSGNEENGVADGSAGWSDAAVINPYTMYLCYGDAQILRNQYSSMKKHVDYMFTKAKNANPNRAAAPEYHNCTDGELDADYIWDTEFHWGEWLEADVGTAGEMQRMIEKFTNPDPEVPTAFLCYSTELFSQIARILGETEDAEHYAAKAQKVKRMFNRYLIGADGIIKAGRQAPNVRALAFDLCDETHREPVLNALTQMVKDCDYHINTGFLATPHILNVLADSGFADTAYRLLEQESSPSWLYNVKKGATSILEEWSGMDTHVGSFNHYSYGAVCDFLFSRVAGIRPTWEKPGYQEFLVQPVIDGSLSHAEAVYESLYGTIRSEWKRSENTVQYRISVPVNTTAKIVIPGSKETLKEIHRTYPQAESVGNSIVISVGSGDWHLSV